MPWIESHTVLLRHRKVISLAKDLRLKSVYCLGHLHALWHAALEQRYDGDLSEWSDEFIAENAAYSGDAPRFVSLLQKHGWLDGKLLHDWLDYAGRYLIAKYASKDRACLVRIWAVHGRVYGKESDGKVKDLQPPVGKVGEFVFGKDGGLGEEKPADAKAIVDAYQHDVGTAHPPAGAQNAVLEILGNNEATKDELLKAIKAWAPACKRANADATKRMSAAKWFRDGCWRDFINGNAVVNDPDAAAKARAAKERAEMERRLAEDAEGERKKKENPLPEDFSFLAELERFQKLKRQEIAAKGG